MGARTPATTGSIMLRLTLKIHALRLTRGALRFLIRLLSHEIKRARDHRAWLAKRREEKS
jgi:hypothetical protein